MNTFIPFHSLKTSIHSLKTSICSLIPSIRRHITKTKTRQTDVTAVTHRHPSSRPTERASGGDDANDDGDDDVHRDGDDGDDTDARTSTRWASPT